MGFFFVLSVVVFVRALFYKPKKKVVDISLLTEGNSIVSGCVTYKCGCHASSEGIRLCPAHEAIVEAA